MKIWANNSMSKWILHAFRISLVAALLVGTSPTTGLADLTPTESSADTTTEVSTEKYDMQWHLQDREAFAKELEKAEKKLITRQDIHKEYLVLAEAMNAINQKAYRSSRGYIVYSPEISNQLNIVWTALRARSELILDFEDYLSELDYYYPTYDYIIAYPSPVTPATNSYQSYNENEVSTFLDSLPIPDYFFYGTKIWFINGTSYGSGYTETHPMRGFFDATIVIFRSDDPEFIKAVLAHEVGHTVGQEIFSTYTPDNFYIPKDNMKNLNTYARIYQKPVDLEEYNWGEMISENFAEDFKFDTTGAEKVTYWPGGKQGEVIQFVNTNIGALPLDQIPIVREVDFHTDGITVPYFDIGYLEYGKDWFVSTGKATISLEGLQNASCPTVIVHNGLSLEYYPIVNGEAEIVLPPGECLVVVGDLSAASGYKNLLTEFARFTVYSLN